LSLSFAPFAFKAFVLAFVVVLAFLVVITLEDLHFCFNAVHRREH